MTINFRRGLVGLLASTVVLLSAGCSPEKQCEPKGENIQPKPAVENILYAPTHKNINPKPISKEERVLEQLKPIAQRFGYTCSTMIDSYSERDKMEYAIQLKDIVDERNKIIREAGCKSQMEWRCVTRRNDFDGTMMGPVFRPHYEDKWAPIRGFVGGWLDTEHTSGDVHYSRVEGVHGINDYVQCEDGPKSKK